MDKYKLAQLLNARHEDLQFELGVYLQLHQLEDYKGLSDDLLVEMEARLIEKLDIDLEEVEEEEENLQDAFKVALSESQQQLMTYTTMDRNSQQLKLAGASEDELEGYNSFKKRLEKVLFERYNVTDEDLKEGEENE